MLNYADIFNTHRGVNYDAAMKGHPQARDAEFLQLFAGVDIRDYRRVLDCPAGGGYLQRYLPPGCEITALDPSDGFLANAPSVMKVSFQNFELPRHHFDAAVCLAALHHIEPKKPFVSALASSVIPGGYLFIGDVLQDSKEALFLDGFVGQYNQTGHEGVFLPDDPAYLAELTGSAGTLIRSEYSSCPWHFSTELEAANFCRRLFSIEGISDDELLTALKSYIGLSVSGGGVMLDWALLYATYRISDAPA